MHAVGLAAVGGYTSRRGTGRDEPRGGPDHGRRGL